ncbi:hypothetical protein H310_05528 [Aphanomyces invadans]|uniref:RING-type domain-containing protein n=1 Tax=Aphanomyces invadans TaxID=157072 RepID=A0A024UB26_9STRA|nr:hypothetical protein H310_05528 [Aphanomyces invadans]ETW03102.1 hypothetical protein H310_05528 [Aphanomyces invadans]|eukprot:XP_008868486.1 hypothetical protein H310_05528 [Aphanomyces invadans]
MERRWSSIRQDGFKTQCHALWVGPKVVYRVTIETTIMNDSQQDVLWVAAISKSKLQIFQHEIMPLLQANDTSMGPRSHDGEVEALMNRVDEEVQRVLGGIFTDSTTDHKGENVESFVTSLLNVFGLLTSIPLDNIDTSLLTNEMLQFYVLLRNFLAIPDGVQHARNKLALAVLSMKDVEDLPGNCCNGSCSICLEPWDCTPNLPPTVKLPCDHVFHEDCVMVWVRQSVKCPVCRAPIGQIPLR